VTVVVDAGPLVALADQRDPDRDRVEAVLVEEQGALVLPAPISAEVDYLVRKRVGRHAQRLFLEDLADGRFVVASLEAADYATITELDRTYDDLDAGLADLSIVVLARRFGTRRIVTFDERHFRALRPLDGGGFTLLPADA
jgi:predicted nucleic acid-binding protein